MSIFLWVCDLSHIDEEGQPVVRVRDRNQTAVAAAEMRDHIACKVAGRGGLGPEEDGETRPEFHDVEFRFRRDSLDDLGQL